MAEILGANIPIPNFEFSGFFSNSWIYVMFISLIFLLLVVTIVLITFYRNYRIRVEFYENISGQGFQKVKVRRARILKLGVGGEELLRLVGGEYMSAYGRKMGRNTYWFAKGEDGYWYNFLLGDLDAKRAILDIEPVDRDVRMFHVAKDRLNKETYGKVSFLEKYSTAILGFIFLVVLIIGMWIIIGQIGDATQTLSSTAKTNADVAKQTSETLNALANVMKSSNSGVVPAGG